MRNFFAIFLGWLAVVLLVLFFFGNFLLTTIWEFIILFTLLSTVCTAVFLKQQIRIENLEKKMEKLLHPEQE